VPKKRKSTLSTTPQKHTKVQLVKGVPKAHIRNISGYDHAGMISDQEAKEMVNLASLLRQEVEGWLRENHPDLMEE